MNSTATYAHEQYELVRDARRALFDYCKTISPDDLLDQNTAYGQGGSIRNLLVHIANTYIHWVARMGLKNNTDYHEFEDFPFLDEIIRMYEDIDNLVFTFIAKMDSTDQFDVVLNKQNVLVKPFKLFTHVITHEFHHKGQILLISRHLGYTPVDTDIMR
ncbi:MAG: DinB family protein [Bacteroidota bacterium]|nr:DinB family protein [Bacteroidota bacterium]